MDKLNEYDLELLTEAVGRGAWAIHRLPKLSYFIPWKFNHPWQQNRSMHWSYFRTWLSDENGGRRAVSPNDTGVYEQYQPKWKNGQSS